VGIVGRSLSGAVKLISQQNNDNNQLCDLRFGSVISVSPLKVKISSQLTLPQSVLITPKRLTNYDVKIVDAGTEKTITIKNALKIGDKVALIRKTGGQSYFILDRI
jgi:hypothetical protein